MQRFLLVLAIVAILFGATALATPAVSDPTNPPPRCSQHGRRCGTPEPDLCTGPCEYWEPCGKDCGCKLLPGCTPP
jgi:hypothetical protein